MAHDGANRHDSKLLAPTLDSVPITRPEPSVDNPQSLCLDGGYAYLLHRRLSGKAGIIGATAGPLVIIDLLLVFLIWAIGLGALFFLWRPDSSNYFKSGGGG